MIHLLSARILPTDLPASVTWRTGHLLPILGLCLPQSSSPCLSVSIALVQILRQTRSGWSRLASTLVWWLGPSSHLASLGLVLLLLGLPSYSPAVAAKTPRQTKQGRAARCGTQSARHRGADRVHEFGRIAEGSQERRTYGGAEDARQKDQKKR